MTMTKIQAVYTALNIRLQLQPKLMRVQRVDILGALNYKLSLLLLTFNSYL